MPKEGNVRIDLENGFKPEYVNSTDRADVIKNLQIEANKYRHSSLRQTLIIERGGYLVAFITILDVDPDKNVRVAFLKLHHLL